MDAAAMNNTIAAESLFRRLFAGNRRRKLADKGFTLIELTVSITLMGILAVAIQTGFRLGINAWKKGESSLERSRAAEASLELILRHLGSIVPYYSAQIFNESPTDVLVFQGTAKGLRFVSSFSSTSRSSAGLQLVEFFLAMSADHQDKVLVLQERNLPSDRVLRESVFNGFFRRDDMLTGGTFFAFSPRRDAIELVPGLQDAEFRFLHERVPTDGGKRSVSPRKREPLPVGIEIRLRWKEPQWVDRQEFSIVVPVHAAS
jgi:prepilin-type N-terminal cleavage/methylation domain-containing protein